MTIQSMPQAATLTWEGLRNLPIPQEVRQGCVFNEIELSRKGIDELPAPLNRATCWIYCREAWTHSDPDFEGDIFITLAVQADHRYCQLVPGTSTRKSRLSLVFCSRLIRCPCIGLRRTVMTGRVSLASSSRCLTTLRTSSSRR